MVKRKVVELEGAALDWAVATAEGRAVSVTPFFASLTSGGQSSGICVFEYETKRPYRPSMTWGQAGPLIDQYDVWFSSEEEGVHIASAMPHSNRAILEGPTKLIAAMRALVAHQLGEEVEIPEELANA